MFEDMAEHLPPGPPSDELIPDTIAITATYGFEMVMPAGVA